MAARGRPSAGATTTTALRPAAMTPLLLLLLLLLLIISAAPTPTTAHRHKRRKSNAPSCTTLDKNCGFLTQTDLTWKKQVGVFVLTSDGTTVSCAPQSDDGLAQCEYVDELQELRMQVSCPGDYDYAIFQAATGLLVDVQPDGTATFDPWVPGVTQSVLDATAYATAGGVYGPPVGEESYWSMEVMCQPEFYPDGYPPLQGASGGGGLVASGGGRQSGGGGGVRRGAVVRVSTVSSAAAARASGSSKKAAAAASSSSSG